MGFKMTLTIPKPNLNWYRDGKKEFLKIVEDYNKESWEKERDPVTQTKWQPRAQPTGGWPILNKTGKMFESTKFRASDRPFDFKATVGVKYGGFHQRGTSKMPQRRWLGVGSDIDDKLIPVFQKRMFKGKYKFVAET
jgi:phage gpG-like protein